MLLVHDHICTGYRYSGERRQLVLETEYPCGSGKPGARSEVVFEGVWCHHLESVQAGNVLLDIEQVDVARLEQEYHLVFDRLKNYGWPRMEKKGDSLSEIVERYRLHVYLIQPSYGMEGFVVAERAHQVNCGQEG